MNHFNNTAVTFSVISRHETLFYILIGEWSDLVHWFDLVNYKIILIIKMILIHLTHVWNKLVCNYIIKKNYFNNDSQWVHYTPIHLNREKLIFNKTHSGSC